MSNQKYNECCELLKKRTLTLTINTFMKANSAVDVL